MNSKPIIITVVIAAVTIAGLFALSNMETNSEYSQKELTSLAVCLRDNGAKFYGAYWCGHCQAQKRDFGSAVEQLPFIECSTPDGNDQVEECKAAGITSYPTWEFADGGLIMGRVPLPQLAQRTGCELPGVELIEEVDSEVDDMEVPEAVMEVTGDDLGVMATETPTKTVSETELIQE